MEDVPLKNEDPQDMQQKKDEGSLDSEKPNAKPEPKDETPESKKKNGISTKVLLGAGAAVGGVGLVVAAPFVVSAVGFTSAGIAAGSWAASMMSSAAIASGGGVAAGGAVAALQSAGAVGIPLAANAALGAAGAAAGATVGGIGAGVASLVGSGKEDKPDDKKSDDGGKDDKPDGGKK